MKLSDSPYLTSFLILALTAFALWCAWQSVRCWLEERKGRK